VRPLLPPPVFHVWESQCFFFNTEVPDASALGDAAPAASSDAASAASAGTGVTPSRAGGGFGEPNCFWRWRWSQYLFQQLTKKLKLTQYASN
jgi:hypothetical protein